METIDIEAVSHTADLLQDFISLIDAARTVQQLQYATAKFRPLFRDADEVAQTMTDEDFLEWRSGLQKERKRQFAGEAFAEKYGALLMPLLAIPVTNVTSRLHVPFGLAFNRLKEVGEIRIKDGCAEWVR